MVTPGDYERGDAMGVATTSSSCVGEVFQLGRRAMYLVGSIFVDYYPKF